MKKQFLLLLIILFSCSNEKKEVSKPFISLKNPMAVERTAEPIVISQEQIQKHLLNDVKTQKEIYFTDEKGNKIPFQKDVLEGKREYSFSLDFNPNEIKKLFINFSDSALAFSFTHYTNVRLGKDDNADGIYEDVDEEVRDPNHLPGSVPVLYQAEGISWENDKVGFRIYWDKRNGKDIWGKTTDKMVMDSVGLPGTPSYHEIQPWGADVLKVGNSLGAGALAMVKNNKLIRLGDTKTAYFKVLTEGPIRTVFDLKYTGWNVGGEEFGLDERISIWKGKYGYKSDVHLKGSKQKIVTGIVNINLKKDTLYVLHPNKNKTLLYTYGKQSEFNDHLGMALILNTDELIDIKKAPNTGTGRSIDGNSPISHTYYTELEGKDNKVSFYFYAGWERTNPDFKTRKGFEKMLIFEVEKMNNPIIIE